MDVSRIAHVRSTDRLKKNIITEIAAVLALPRRTTTRWAASSDKVEKFIPRRRGAATSDDHPRAGGLPARIDGHEAFGAGAVSTNVNKNAARPSSSRTADSSKDKAALDDALKIAGGKQIW